MQLILSEGNLNSDFKENLYVMCFVQLASGRNVGSSGVDQIKV